MTEAEDRLLYLKYSRIFGELAASLWADSFSHIDEFPIIKTYSDATETSKYGIICLKIAFNYNHQEYFLGRMILLEEIESFNQFGDVCLYYPLVEMKRQLDDLFKSEQTQTI